VCFYVESIPLGLKLWLPAPLQSTLALTNRLVWLSRTSLIKLNLAFN